MVLGRHKWIREKTPRELRRDVEYIEKAIKKLKVKREYLLVLIEKTPRELRRDVEYIEKAIKKLKVKHEHLLMLIEKMSRGTYYM